MSQQNERHDFSEQGQTCPRCSQPEVRKSILHSSDRLVRKFFYRPYRCRICHLRFWQVSSLKVALFAVVIGPAIILAILWAATSDSLITERLAEAQMIDTTSKDPTDNDAEAELQMGLSHLIGDGVAKDAKKATQWFEKAANHGNAEAQYRYGLALQEGRGVLQDYKAAFHWLEKAAQQGHPQAQYNFGQIYRAGIGVDVDKARAYLWFNLAAAQGVGEAATARDSLVWQLGPQQVSALQEESRRLNQALYDKATKAQSR